MSATYHSNTLAKKTMQRFLLLLTFSLPRYINMERLWQIQKMAISLRFRYACCTRVKASREPKTRPPHSYLPNTMLWESPPTIHANSQIRAHTHRVMRECLKEYSYARATSWVWHVQGKDILQGIHKAVCAQTYTHHTEHTHTHTRAFERTCTDADCVSVCALVWELSKIWKGTAVSGCINYKKIMNQRKGKSVCMQVRVCITVCSSGIVPTCLLNKYFLVCASVCVHASVNAGAIYLHYAPLSSHKEAGNEAGI